jgi:hypothetical protein
MCCRWWLIGGPGGDAVMGRSISAIRFTSCCSSRGQDDFGQCGDRIGFPIWIDVARNEHFGGACVLSLPMRTRVVRATFIRRAFADASDPGWRGNGQSQRLFRLLQLSRGCRGSASRGLSERFAILSGIGMGLPPFDRPRFRLLTGNGGLIPELSVLTSPAPESTHCARAE